jgi:DNA end-binding protein Ku
LHGTLRAGRFQSLEDEMPHPIWKGQISFGLVNVPVTLYSAEQKQDLEFKLIDSRNS